MARKTNAAGRSVGEPGHVRLYRWMMHSLAWRDLHPNDRCTYIELASRYYGSNNGRIVCSVLEIAQALHIGKATALRSLRSLQEHGFIVQTKIGAFSVKNRQASEWRLTEFRNDLTGELPDKDFMRWRPTERDAKNSEYGIASKPERVSA